MAKKRESVSAELCHVCGAVADMLENRANTAHHFECKSCGATLMRVDLGFSYPRNLSNF